VDRPLDGDFLADLSHDLRTPLNGILGFAALLHEEKLGPLSADQKECLGDVLTSANEMLHLINEVSDLGKAEAGTLELTPAPVQLAAVLDEVRDGLQRLSSQKQVRVTAVVDPALTGIVTDAQRLEQIVAACAVHAVKATPADGHVTIRAAGLDAAWFLIEVEDTSRRPKDIVRDGSVGLILARRIAELQGGELGVRTMSDHRSVLYARLPRAPEGSHGR
jgi:signal transduction histidine kinase